MCMQILCPTFPCTFLLFCWQSYLLPFEQLQSCPFTLNQALCLAAHTEWKPSFASWMLFFITIGVSLFIFSASHIHHALLPQGISSLKNFRPDFREKKIHETDIFKKKKKKKVHFLDFLLSWGKKMECFRKLGNAWKNTAVGWLLHCSPASLIMNSNKYSLRLSNLFPSSLL